MNSQNANNYNAKQNDGTPVRGTSYTASIVSNASIPSIISRKCSDKSLHESSNDKRYPTSVFRPFRKFQCKTGK